MVGYPQNTAGHLQATTSLTFDGTKWKTTLRYGIANVSKTPAFSVSMKAVPYIHSDVIGAVDVLSKLCNDVKHPPMMGAPSNAYSTGTVIFPGTEIIIPDVSFEFTKSAVDAAMKESGGAHFANVFVEICVGYQSPDSADKHASGASYLAIARGEASQQ